MELVPTSRTQIEVRSKVNTWARWSPATNRGHQPPISDQVTRSGQRSSSIFDVVRGCWGAAMELFTLKPNTAGILHYKLSTSILNLPDGQIPSFMIKHHWPITLESDIALRWYKLVSFTHECFSYLQCFHSATWWSTLNWFFPQCYFFFIV